MISEYTRISQDTTQHKRKIMDTVHFSSVAQLCPTLCDPMNRSTPGLPVHHQLPEFTQTHVHRVSDAIQPSHPLSSPSPPAPMKVHISLVYTKFSFSVPGCHLGQITFSHHVSSGSLFGCIFQTFLVSDNLENFQEYRSDIL